MDRASGNGNKNPDKMLKNIEPGMANDCKLNIWLRMYDFLNYKLSVDTGNVFISHILPLIIHINLVFLQPNHNFYLENNVLHTGIPISNI